MITKLSINNFKSIKELDIDCARVNLFIGEPNTGKSNILEALGVLSWCATKNLPLNDFVRFEYMENLFYDNLPEQPLSVSLKENNNMNVEIEFNPQNNFFPVYYWDMSYTDLFNSRINVFNISHGFLTDLETGKISDDLRNLFRDRNRPLSDKSRIRRGDQGEWFIEDDLRDYVISDKVDSLQVDLVGRTLTNLSNSMEAFGKNNIPDADFIKFYRFKEQNKFPSRFSSWLIPPYGSNLVSLISGNKKIRETASDLFRDFGFKVMLREHVETLELAKIIDDVIYSYPYITISDTLQRMLFYNSAIDSNENSTLVFEEPEVHAFPSYIKQLGEKIAYDGSNQYFIVTHNPYLFLSIVEKTPKKDVNVFATYMKDYQTKVKQANSEQVSMLMDYDPFFNLGQIIEEDDNDSD